MWRRNLDREWWPDLSLEKDSTGQADTDEVERMGSEREFCSWPSPLVTSRPSQNRSFLAKGGCVLPVALTLDHLAVDFVQASFVSRSNNLQTPSCWPALDLVVAS